VNLPERPVFQPPVPPPVSSIHRGVVHPVSLRRDSADEDVSPYKAHISHRSILNPSAVTLLPVSAEVPLVSDRNNDIIPERLLYLEVACTNLKLLTKLGNGIFGEVCKQVTTMLKTYNFYI